MTKYISNTDNKRIEKLENEITTNKNKIEELENEIEKLKEMLNQHTEKLEELSYAPGQYEFVKAKEEFEGKLLNYESV